MPKFKFLTTNSIIALLSISCANYTFKPLPPQEFPPQLAMRAQLTNYSTYQDHMEDLVGHLIVVKKKDGKCPDPGTRVFEAIGLDGRDFLVSGAKLQPKALSRNMYEARFTTAATTNWFFPVVGVNFAGKSAVEFVITDTMIVEGSKFIDRSKVEQLKLAPMPNNHCARFLIKDAILSVINYKTYTEIDNSNTVAGSAFSAGGKIHHSGDQFQPSFMISLEMEDATPETMPSLTAAPPPDANHAPHKPRLFELVVPETGNIPPID